MLMICIVGDVLSSPAISITWSPQPPGRSSLNSDGTTLTITNVTTSDATTFYCNGTNSAGTAFFGFLISTVYS